MSRGFAAIVVVMLLIATPKVAALVGAQVPTGLSETSGLQEAATAKDMRKLAVAPFDAVGLRTATDRAVVNFVANPDDAILPRFRLGEVDTSLHRVSLALTPDEAHAIICAPGLTWDCDTMMFIAHRESRLTPTATNLNCWPDYPYQWVCVGLFQHILPAGVDGSWLYDPIANRDLAYDKYLSGGMGHWRTE